MFVQWNTLWISEKMKESRHKGECTLLSKICKVSKQKRKLNYAIRSQGSG